MLALHVGRKMSPTTVLIGLKPVLCTKEMIAPPPSLICFTLTGTCQRGMGRGGHGHIRDPIMTVREPKSVNRQQIHHKLLTFYRQNYRTVAYKSPVSTSEPISLHLCQFDPIQMIETNEWLSKRKTKSISLFSNLLLHQEKLSKTKQQTRRSAKTTNVTLMNCFWCCCFSEGNVSQFVQAAKNFTWELPKFWSLGLSCERRIVFCAVEICSPNTEKEALTRTKDRTWRRSQKENSVMICINQKQCWGNCGAKSTPLASCFPIGPNWMGHFCHMYTLYLA